MSKESIFSGFNNVHVDTILDKEFSDAFGFTEEEVKGLLSAFGFRDYHAITKDYYDGYRVGGRSMYCPWDVINWVWYLEGHSSPKPQNFWANTSSNDILHRFVDLADGQTHEELEALIARRSIYKPIHLNLTYADLDSSIGNIWSVLLTTGYLTTTGEQDADGRYELHVPNGEIEQLLKSEYENWFRTNVYGSTGILSTFVAALDAGNVEKAQHALQHLLDARVRLRDLQVTDGRKEIYYHGLLNGFFLHIDRRWSAMSNTDRGDGYPDIVLQSYGSRNVCILELKYADAADSASMVKAANAAIDQIRARRYTEDPLFADVPRLHAYGVAFHGRTCMLKLMTNEVRRPQ